MKRVLFIVLVTSYSAISFAQPSTLTRQRVISQSFYSYNSGGPLFLSDSNIFKYKGSNHSNFDYNNFGYNDGAAWSVWPETLVPNNIDSSNYYHVYCDTALSFHLNNFGASLDTSAIGNIRYNSNGFPTDEDAYSNFARGQFFNSERYNTTYSAGVPKTFYYSVKHGIRWDTMTVHYYGHNSLSKLITDTTWVNQASIMVPAALKTISYNPRGLYDTLTYYHYDTGSHNFIKYSRLSYQYNTRGQVSIFYTEQFIGGAFMPSERDSFGYTLNVPGRTYTLKHSLDTAYNVIYEIILKAERINSLQRIDSFSTSTKQPNGTYALGDCVSISYDVNANPVGRYTYAQNSGKLLDATLWYYENYLIELPDSELSIKMEKKNVYVLPNPFKQKITIHSDNLQTLPSVMVLIFDALGHVVYKKLHKGPRYEYQIELTDELLSGLYFISIQDDKQNIIYNGKLNRL